MEPKFQTSFIPKKPVDSSQSSSISVAHSTNIFSVLATIIFLATLLTSSGLFAYKKILENQIIEADKNIVAAQASFEPEKTKELLDISDKISSAKNLLEKHVVVSEVLVLMQNLTVRKMRFTEFEYTNKNNNPSLSIKAEVQTYNALAEQQDVFLKNEFILNPVFSNFSLADNGYIVVDFTSGLDPSLVSYKKAVESLPLN